MHTKPIRASVTVAFSASLILVVCAASPAPPPETKTDAACEERMAAESESTGEEASGEASAEPSESSTPPIGPIAAPGATFQLSTELDDPDPNTSSNCKEARALFKEALVTERKVYAVTVNGSNEQQLKARIKKKMKIATKTQQMFEDVIEKDCPEWTTAAQFHIGLQHANWAETILESGVPTKLTDKQTKIYCGLLFDRSGKEFCKAVAAWKQTAEVGEENEVRNTWTDKAADYVKTGRLDKQAEVDACVKHSREIPTKTDEEEDEPDEGSDFDDRLEIDESVIEALNDPLIRRALKACEKDSDCPYPLWQSY